MKERDYGITVVDPKREEESTKVFRRVKRIEEDKANLAAIATVASFGAVGMYCLSYLLINGSVLEDPYTYYASAAGLPVLGGITITTIKDMLEKPKEKVKRK